METSQATIWHDQKQNMYLIFSPDDGIHRFIERGYEVSWRLSEYKTPDDIDICDIDYYYVVSDIIRRELLLQSAMETLPLLLEK